MLRKALLEGKAAIALDVEDVAVLVPRPCCQARTMGRTVGQPFQQIAHKETPHSACCSRQLRRSIHGLETKPPSQ